MWLICVCILPVMRGDSSTGQKWLWMVGNVFNRVSIGMVLSILYDKCSSSCNSQPSFPADELDLVRFYHSAWPRVLWLSMSDLRAEFAFKAAAFRW